MLVARMSRPRKQIFLNLTERQARLVLDALEFNSDEENLVVQNTIKKVSQGSSLTESQAKAVLDALETWRRYFRPTTGSWRAANKKVRKALEVWIEEGEICTVRTENQRSSSGL